MANPVSSREPQKAPRSASAAGARPAGQPAEMSEGKAESKKTGQKKATARSTAAEAATALEPSMAEIARDQEAAGDVPSTDAAAHSGGSLESARESVREVPLAERFAEQPELLSERLIDLPSLLDDLVREGFVSQRQAEDILIAPRSKKELLQHPMEIVADREYENRNKPGHKLDLDTLTLWLAAKAKQPYARIDPLKVNVNAVTEVMSYAFAQRHNILALEVTDNEVVIASAQPFMHQWEGMLTQTLRGRRIKRKIANPKDLSKYMLEFYTMARSVSRAEEAGFEVSGIANLEQMLELGATEIAGCERRSHRQHRRLAPQLRLRTARQ